MPSPPPGWHRCARCRRSPPPLLLYVGLDALALIQNNPWGRSAPAILKGIFIYAAVTALISAVMAPREPQWRLAALDDRPARRIARLLGAITAVYALDGALTEVARAFSVRLSLSVVQSFVASTVFAALLIGLLLTPFAPQGATAPVSRHAPRWLKLPLWVAAVGIVVAALLGYVALARFATQQLVLTGIVALLGWLGYLAIRAFTREPPQRGLPVGDLLERRFGLDAPRRHQLARLTELALTFALAVGLLPVLMLQWGFSGADIRDWLKGLLFGVEIGQFRISLVRILAGIVLFIALLFATRLLQRWLRERMVQSRMDAGIANSIEVVVGYACTALAALLAVSYAGFDITSLAIVAGALSLGIGFGLQSIVNNFVSGLILLIERPIKVGDRIVIGDQQGHVRRISVRSTEIETFDRASVIVPNSELIMGRVVNWTHRDWLGAVSVKIGVAYDCDPERVIAILREVRRGASPGAAHPAAEPHAGELRRQRAHVQSAHLGPRHRQGGRRAVRPACRHPQGIARGRHRDPLQPARRQHARPGGDQVVSFGSPAEAPERRRPRAARACRRGEPARRRQPARRQGRLSGAAGPDRCHRSLRRRGLHPLRQSLSSADARRPLCAGQTGTPWTAQAAGARDGTVPFTAHAVAAKERGPSGSPHR